MTFIIACWAVTSVGGRKGGCTVCGSRQGKRGKPAGKARLSNLKGAGTVTGDGSRYGDNHSMFSCIHFCPLPRFLQHILTGVTWLSCHSSQLKMLHSKSNLWEGLRPLIQLLFVNQRTLGSVTVPEFPFSTVLRDCHLVESWMGPEASYFCIANTMLLLF